MKRIIAFIFGFGIAFGATAQIDVETISRNACECMENNGLKTNEDANTCLTEAISPYADQLTNKEKAETLLVRVYKRLSEMCPFFIKRTKKLNPASNQGDWEVLDKVPEADISKKDIKAFFEYDELFYLESDGEVTRVEVDRKTWTEFLHNEATYSKCKVNWVKKNGFELQFLESNDSFKSKMSTRKSTYQYYLIEKTKHYYYVAAMSGEMVYGFKMYMERPRKSSKS